MEKMHLNLCTGAGATDSHKRKKHCEEYEHDLTDWLSRHCSEYEGSQICQVAGEVKYQHESILCLKEVVFFKLTCANLLI